MSQIDCDSIALNPYDYNLDYVFDGLTNYHGYASETGFQQDVNQSAPEFDNQDVLKQMQARAKAFQSLQAANIGIFWLPGIDEYDYVTRVPIVAGQHQALTDVLHFWAPLPEASGLAVPYLPITINKEEADRQFRYSRSLGAPNHPQQRFDNRLLGHNLDVIKESNSFTDYNVKPLDPVHNPQTVRGPYPPVQSFPLNKPFIILTSPEGEIDWLPPDRSIEGFGPVYDDFSLQELIEEWCSSSDIPVTSSYEDSTPSEEEHRGIKRKRED